MAGKPGSESPAEREGDRTHEDGGELERVGPLVLERHVKDDGRALILYSHARREQT
jgi:hypothetical protein